MYKTRYGVGWFRSDTIDKANVKKYAKIRSFAFGLSAEGFGLHLTLDLENGGSVGWSFFGTDEMQKFFMELGIEESGSLKDKIVETWWEKDSSWGSQILGLSVNKNLV